MTPLTDAAGTLRTLPIRVGVVAGESLDSWLEAYCRRLGLTARTLLAHAGIGTTTGTLPDYTVLLRPSEADRLAGVTGVAVAGLHAMTLRVFAPHAVQLDQQRRAVARAMWWATLGRDSGSRYCPACLAERNGRWLLAWRLPWVFACTDHRLMLCDRCPACGQVPSRSVATAVACRPASTCPNATTRGRRCGADLLRAIDAALAADDRLLATQRWINALLAAADHHTTAEPATTTSAVASALADLRTVTGWLLRQSTEADFHGFGPQVIGAWHAFHTPSGRAAPGRLPPAAALIGATAARAKALINDDDEQAIGQLRVLLRRSHGRRWVRPPRPPGLARQHWTQLAARLQNRFLRALDPDLAAADRVRYRTVTPKACLPLPDDDPAAIRARHVPQLLWPEWTIRLLPVNGFLADQFRATMSACLLLPGHLLAEPSRLTSHLPTQRPLRIASTLRSLADQGHQSVLIAICHLADYLDEHRSPIDYQRRRAAIPPITITSSDWQQLCYQAGAHPGQARRLLDAQRYLYQLLTGADLGDRRHRLAFRSAADRSTCLAFTELLTSPLRDALADHAARQLDQLSIDEPLTWQPPPDCCQDLKLPGRDPNDINLDVVHQLVVIDRLPPGAAATRLGTTIDHIRLALERTPRTPRHWGATAAPTVWQRRQHAQHVLTHDFLEREYIAAGKHLRQIAAETGLPTRLVARHARHAGIPLTRGHHTTPIDQDWLREQYLDRKRSFTDIAAELGVSEMTVNRAAHRYRIPIRPAGVTSRPAMVRTLDTSIPRDIRHAVEGGLYGWQRLHRFQQAMGFPTIEAAADHLGAHQSTLVRQLQRLERDIGAQLYHRAARALPLRPTRRGAVLLKALDQPAVRALIQKMPDR